MRAKHTWSEWWHHYLAGSFNTISDKLRRYMAISSSLQSCTAYMHLSNLHLGESQAGKAVRCCEVRRNRFRCAPFPFVPFETTKVLTHSRMLKEARQLLGKCKTVAEGEAQWVDVISKCTSALDSHMWVDGHMMCGLSVSCHCLRNNWHAYSNPSVLPTEILVVYSLRSYCEGQRTRVFLQKVPPLCPSLVDGKILAKKIGFNPGQIK